MIKTIGNVTLNYTCYSGKDLYSDGASEDVLLDIVKKHEESEFSRIIYESQSWPVLYHLSHYRKNIIEWFPMEKTDSVLEVGAGCGAITGCLADKAGSVTCIELSEKRSLINAYRNKNKNNIEILLGNFQDVEKNLQQKFDVITLIGVLEYAESYIDSKEPYVHFLEIIRRHLKPGGKILVAIENKLGMKYWAGCKEDHTGRYFEGIEGYPCSKGIQTFSKQELEALILSAGFSEYKFYYPYPDYKLPMAIYSDERLPKENELQINVLNFDSDRLVLFNEAKAFSAVIKEGAFPMFSNSYLVCAENGGNG